MTSLSNNPRSHVVDPSPTPMMPTAGDSSTAISMPLLMNASAKIIAVIQPAVPPPTMTTFLKVAGIFVSRADSPAEYDWLKTVAVGPSVLIAGAARLLPRRPRGVASGVEHHRRRAVDERGHQHLVSGRRIEAHERHRAAGRRHGEMPVLGHACQVRRRGEVPDVVDDGTPRAIDLDRLDLRVLLGARRADRLEEHRFADDDGPANDGASFREEVGEAPRVLAV